MCVFITAGPITKLFAGGGRAEACVDESAHQSRTSERGGFGDCVKEGGGAEGEWERERALGVLLCDILGH